MRYGLDTGSNMTHNRYISNSAYTSWLTNKGSKMAIEIGQTLKTAKSGVEGTVQEVIKNSTGSFRVRLDVNGQPRWTTVK
jgi:hypothetical protein